MNSREVKEQQIMTSVCEKKHEQKCIKEGTASISSSEVEGVKCNNPHHEQKDVGEEQDKEMENIVVSMERPNSGLQLLDGESNSTEVDNGADTKVTCCDDSSEGSGNKKDVNTREGKISSGPTIEKKTVTIDNPILAMLTEEQPQIDAIIEEVARRRNLTVLNVKSILRVRCRIKYLAYVATYKLAFINMLYSGLKCWKPYLLRNFLMKKIFFHNHILQLIAVMWRTEKISFVS